MGIPDPGKVNNVSAVSATVPKPVVKEEVSSKPKPATEVLSPPLALPPPQVEVSPESIIKELLGEIPKSMIHILSPKEFKSAITSNGEDKVKILRVYWYFGDISASEIEQKKAEISKQFGIPVWSIYEAASKEDIRVVAEIETVPGKNDFNIAVLYSALKKQLGDRPIADLKTDQGLRFRATQSLLELTKFFGVSAPLPAQPKPAKSPLDEAKAELATTAAGKSIDLGNGASLEIFFTVKDGQIDKLVVIRKQGISRTVIAKIDEKGIWTESGVEEEIIALQKVMVGAGWLGKNEYVPGKFDKALALRLFNYVYSNDDLLNPNSEQILSGLKSTSARVDVLKKKAVAALRSSLDISLKWQAVTDLLQASLELMESARIQMQGNTDEQVVKEAKQYFAKTKGIISAIMPYIIGKEGEGLDGGLIFVDLKKAEEALKKYSKPDSKEKKEEARQSAAGYYGQALLRLRGWERTISWDIGIVKRCQELKGKIIDQLKNLGIESAEISAYLERDLQPLQESFVKGYGSEREKTEEDKLTSDQLARCFKQAYLISTVLGKSNERTILIELAYEFMKDNSGVEPAQVLSEFFKLVKRTSPADLNAFGKYLYISEETSREPTEDDALNAVRAIEEWKKIPDAKVKNAVQILVLIFYKLIRIHNTYAETEGLPEINYKTIASEGKNLCDRLMGVKEVELKKIFKILMGLSDDPEQADAEVALRYDSEFTMIGLKGVFSEADLMQLRQVGITPRVKAQLTADYAKINFLDQPVMLATLIRNSTLLAYPEFESDGKLIADPAAIVLAYLEAVGRPVGFVEGVKKYFLGGGLPDSSIKETLISLIYSREYNKNDLKKAVAILPKYSNLTFKLPNDKFLINKERRSIKVKEAPITSAGFPENRWIGETYNVKFPTLASYHKIALIKLAMFNYVGISDAELLVSQGRVTDRLTYRDIENIALVFGEGIYYPKSGSINLSGGEQQALLEVMSRVLLNDAEQAVMKKVLGLNVKLTKDEFIIFKEALKKIEKEGVATSAEQKRYFGAALLKLKSAAATMKHKEGMVIEDKDTLLALAAAMKKDNLEILDYLLRPSEMSSSFEGKVDKNLYRKAMVILTRIHWQLHLLMEKLPPEEDTEAGIIKLYYETLLESGTQAISSPKAMDFQIIGLPPDQVLGLKLMLFPEIKEAVIEKAAEIEKFKAKIDGEVKQLVENSAIPGIYDDLDRIAKQLEKLQEKYKSDRKIQTAIARVYNKISQLVAYLKEGKGNLLALMTVIEDLSSKIKDLKSLLDVNKTVLEEKEDIKSEIAKLPPQLDKLAVELASLSTKRDQLIELSKSLTALEIKFQEDFDYLNSPTFDKRAFDRLKENFSGLFRKGWAEWVNKIFIGQNNELLGPDGIKVDISLDKALIDLFASSPEISFQVVPGEKYEATLAKMALTKILERLPRDTNINLFVAAPTVVFGAGMGGIFNPFRDSMAFFGRLTGLGDIKLKFTSIEDFQAVINSSFATAKYGVLSWAGLSSQRNQPQNLSTAMHSVMLGSPKGVEYFKRKLSETPEGMIINKINRKDAQAFKEYIELEILPRIRQNPEFRSRIEKLRRERKIKINPLSDDYLKNLEVVLLRLPEDGNFELLDSYHSPENLKYLARMLEDMFVIIGELNKSKAMENIDMMPIVYFNPAAIMKEISGSEKTPKSITVVEYPGRVRKNSLEIDQEGSFFHNVEMLPRLIDANWWKKYGPHLLDDIENIDLGSLGRFGLGVLEGGAEAYAKYTLLMGRQIQMGFADMWGGIGDILKGNWREGIRNYLKGFAETGGSFFVFEILPWIFLSEALDDLEKGNYGLAAGKLIIIMRMVMHEVIMGVNAIKWAKGPSLEKTINGMSKDSRSKFERNIKAYEGNEWAALKRTIEELKGEGGKGKDIELLEKRLKTVEAKARAVQIFQQKFNGIGGKIIKYSLLPPIAARDVYRAGKRAVSYMSDGMRMEVIPLDTMRGTPESQMDMLSTIMPREKGLINGLFRKIGFSWLQEKVLKAEFMGGHYVGRELPRIMFDKAAALLRRTTNFNHPKPIEINSRTDLALQAEAMIKYSSEARGKIDAQFYRVLKEQNIKINPKEVSATDRLSFLEGVEALRMEEVRKAAELLEWMRANPKMEFQLSFDRGTERLRGELPFLQDELSELDAGSPEALKVMKRMEKIIRKIHEKTSGIVVDGETLIKFSKAKTTSEVAKIMRSYNARMIQLQGGYKFSIGTYSELFDSLAVFRDALDVQPEAKPVEPLELQPVNVQPEPQPNGEEKPAAQPRKGNGLEPRPQIVNAEPELGTARAALEEAGIRVVGEMNGAMSMMHEEVVKFAITQLKANGVEYVAFDGETKLTKAEFIRNLLPAVREIPGRKLIIFSKPNGAVKAYPITVPDGAIVEFNNGGYEIKDSQTGHLVDKIIMHEGAPDFMDGWENAEQLHEKFDGTDPEAAERIIKQRLQLVKGNWSHLFKLAKGLTRVNKTLGEEVISYLEGLSPDKLAKIKPENIKLLTSLYSRNGAGNAAYQTSVFDAEKEAKARTALESLGFTPDKINQRIFEMRRGRLEYVFGKNPIKKMIEAGLDIMKAPDARTLEKQIGAFRNGSEIAGKALEEYGMTDKLVAQEIKAELASAYADHQQRSLNGMEKILDDAIKNNKPLGSKLLKKYQKLVQAMRRGSSYSKYSGQVDRIADKVDKVEKMAKEVKIAEPAGPELGGSAENIIRQLELNATSGLLKIANEIGIFNEIEGKVTSGKELEFLEKVSKMSPKNIADMLDISEGKATQLKFAAEAIYKEYKYMKNQVELGKQLGLDFTKLNATKLANMVYDAYAKGGEGWRYFSPEKLSEFFATEEGIEFLKSPKGQEFLKQAREIAVKQSSGLNVAMEYGSLIATLIAAFGVGELMDAMGIKNPQAKFIFTMGAIHLMGEAQTAGAFSKPTLREVGRGINVLGRDLYTMGRSLATRTEFTAFTGFKQFMKLRFSARPWIFGEASLVAERGGIKAILARSGARFIKGMGQFTIVMKGLEVLGTKLGLPANSKLVQFGYLLTTGILVHTIEKLVAKKLVNTLFAKAWQKVLGPLGIGLFALQVLDLISCIWRDPYRLSVADRARAMGYYDGTNFERVVEIGDCAKALWLWTNIMASLRGGVMASETYDGSIAPSIKFFEEGGINADMVDKKAAKEFIVTTFRDNKNLRDTIKFLRSMKPAEIEERATGGGSILYAINAAKKYFDSEGNPKPEMLDELVSNEIFKDYTVLFNDQSGGKPTIRYIGVDEDQTISGYKYKPEEAEKEEAKRKGEPEPQEKFFGFDEMIHDLNEVSSRAVDSRKLKRIAYLYSLEAAGKPIPANSIDQQMGLVVKGKLDRSNTLFLQFISRQAYMAFGDAKVLESAMGIEGNAEAVAQLETSQKTAAVAMKMTIIKLRVEYMKTTDIRRKIQIGRELDAMGDKIDPAKWDLAKMESMVAAWEEVFGNNFDETGKGLIYNGISSMVERVFAGNQPSIIRDEDLFVGGYKEYNSGVLSGLTSEKIIQDRKVEEEKLKANPDYREPAKMYPPRNF